MKNKAKKNHTVIVKVSAPKVEMDSKKSVCIEFTQEPFSEEEIKKLMEILEKENREIRLKYYSENTPISSTKQRGFWELVKKFFGNFKKENFIANGNIRRAKI